MLEEVIDMPITLTRFQYDGTQESIDELMAYLSADGGLVEARRIDSTTWELMNPAFNDQFYPRDINEVWVFSKTPVTGAVRHDSGSTQEIAARYVSAV
jgi:hypothetical protein